MSDTLDPLPGMVDIALPAPPEEHGLLLMLLAALLLAGLLLMWLWRERLSVRGRARRRLRQLQTGLREDPEPFAWQLAAILRLGLQLKRLTAGTHLPDKPGLQASRWRAFVQRLDQTRYAGMKLDEDARRHLLDEARYWLRKWP